MAGSAVGMKDIGGIGGCNGGYNGGCNGGRRRLAMRELVASLGGDGGGKALIIVKVRDRLGLWACVD